MKILNIYGILILLFLSALFPACEGLDDNYSSDPNHRLTFSVDTLSFDTVFTTIGSATREFKIYNPNSSALNIESILLAGSGTTGFRMNVDGRKGDSFRDLGIQPNDSMFVFVEVTVDPNDRDQPLLVQDSVMITVNGTRQRVLLEAYGQDVHLWKGGKFLTQDTLLTGERPYLIYDSLVVNPEVKLEIAPGALFYMHDKANVVVHGTLIAEGTMEKPVIFRGDRLDDILYDILPYDRTPGQWGGIFFEPTSFNNILNQTIIRNGTTGITCRPSSPGQSKLKLTNSQVTNMAGNVFTAINCEAEVINSELTNATDTVVALLGGKYQFAHSTIANYIDNVYKRREPSYTLIMSNSQPNDLTAPLEARFDNCIVDGADQYPEPFNQNSAEIFMDKASGEVLLYTFNHCVLNTGDEGLPPSGTILIPTKKDEYDAMYRQIGDRTNKYEFDFRLDSIITPGVAQADPAISALYPIDRYGVNRLTSTYGPSIGAYEFVPKPKGND